MTDPAGHWRNAIRFLALATVLAPVLAACAGGGYGATVKRAAFTSKEFGVAVSPRVTRDPNPPRGGGRHVVGKPYTVRGKTYTPDPSPQGYTATGTASWYGADFHGRRTANGEIFSANAITAAHPTLPLPSYVRVTNTDNGRSLVVRVNDRGPYMHGRIIDLSYRAASILDYVNRGMSHVHVQYLGPAPLEGDDTRMLLASVNRPLPIEQRTTRLAMADPPATRRAGSMSAASEDGRSRGDYSSQDLARDFFSLFGYSDPAAAAGMVTSAHAAANAMASRDTGLQDWVNVVDDDARDIRLQLGVFRDAGAAAELARHFALLGAVDEEQVVLTAGKATRLTLSKLKPGVGRGDVLALAQELGLRDVVLY